MAFQEKILAQLRPTGSSAVTAYTVPANTTSIITTIHICNTTTSDTTFRIFIDNTASTYDETTALYYDTTLSAKETMKIQTHLGMNTAGGTLGIRTANASALTFTINGVEIT